MKADAEFCRRVYAGVGVTIEHWIAVYRGWTVEENVDNGQLISRALAAGWTFERTLLYDEEGIEGFIWEGPNGEEETSFAVDGTWDSGPEVPDAVRRAIGC